MDNKLFQNDSITGNSLIGFNIKGVFKDDENILLEKLKNIFNRNISFSTTEYKLLEPSDTTVVVMKSGNSYVIKTPMYSYFESIFILPKLLTYFKNLKTYNDSYLYFNIGFNDNFIDISQLNVLKFILEFNEDFIFKSFNDISKNTNIKKLSVIKPSNLENCSDSVQKQVNNYKFLGEEDDTFGISFTNINNGYLTFKYFKNINFTDKWEDVLKSLNHTIITLYNTSLNTTFDEKEIEKVDKLNNTFKEFETSFGCYELFSNKYKSIKLSVDLNTDKSVINMVYPSIKDRLFNIIVYNNISDAYINYDTDVSKLQIKDIDLTDCNNLTNIDIVNCDITDSTIKDCDLYDCKIKNSYIIRCNIFGYSNCNDSDFCNCFISKNIQLKDCNVYGQLGKFGGTMIGGTLKDTTVMISMADIHDDVEKDNINEIP